MNGESLNVPHPLYTLPILRVRECCRGRKRGERLLEVDVGGERRDDRRRASFAQQAPAEFENSNSLAGAKVHEAWRIAMPCSPSRRRYI